jgi:hypothetical protein
VTLALLLQAIVATAVSVFLVFEKLAIAVVLYLLLQRSAEAAWNWHHREPSIPAFVSPFPKEADQLEVIGGARRGPDVPEQTLARRFP